MIADSTTKPNAVAVDATLTYFVSFSTTKNTIANIKAIKGFNTITNPPLVATAFPPQNLRKTLNTCPSTAATP